MTLVSLLIIRTSRGDRKCLGARQPAGMEADDWGGPVGSEGAKAHDDRARSLPGIVHGASPLALASRARPAPGSARLVSIGGAGVYSPLRSRPRGSTSALAGAVEPLLLPFMN